MISSVRNYFVSKMNYCVMLFDRVGTPKMIRTLTTLQVKPELKVQFPIDYRLADSQVKILPKIQEGE